MNWLSQNVIINGEWQDYLIIHHKGNQIRVSVENYNKKYLLPIPTYDTEEHYIQLKLFEM